MDPIRNIRNEVSNGNTQLAIDLLRKLMISKGVDDERLDILIMQECNLNISKAEFRKGLVDLNKKGYDLNKINSIILEMTRELESNINPRLNIHKKRVITLSLVFILFSLLVFLKYNSQETIITKDSQDHVISSDISYNTTGYDTKGNIEGLVKILNLRADRIISPLEEEQDTVFKNFLKEFKILHNENIKALNESNFVYSHELTNRIQDLIYQLKGDIKSHNLKNGSYLQSSEYIITDELNQ